MGINWDKWIRRDRSTLYWIGFVSIASAIFFYLTKVSQPDLKSSSDLYFISSEIKDYSLFDGTRGSIVYTFTLNDFNSRFQIIADFINDFKKSKFYEFQGNEVLTVGIAKNDADLLYTSKTINVFHIESPELVYLDPKDTLQTYNSNFMYIVATAFFHYWINCNLLWA